MTNVLIDIDDKLWVEFKKTVTSDKTLNDAVVDLIKERVNMNFQRRNVFERR